MEESWVSAKVKVAVEDCIGVVERALQPYDAFPDEGLVRRLDELHAKVMKRWIPPEERCGGCSGRGEQAGGSHSWSCIDCGGTGRSDGRKQCQAGGDSKPR